jgi:2-polyprenyl-3-methyl-5-hydroxy-6-metoxy-1,4-benzoquinol methylase
VNARAREAAAAKGRRVVARLADLPEQSFDVITAWESLEHIAETDAVMAFVSERLAPDGVFALTVPNLNSPSIRSLRGDSMHIHGGTAFAGHINLFTHRSLAVLFGRFGLEIVSATGQYSMNLYELIGYHLGKWRGARDYLTKKKIEVELPEDIVQLISAIGPVVASWEESHAMAPILRVTARRKRTARRT